MTSCKTSDCTRTTRGGGLGLCQTHYMREYRKRPHKPRPPCSICGGLNYAKGLCSAHYQRQYKRGTTDRWVPKMRYTTARGYVEVVHPSSTRTDGRVMEHRLVMAEALGRPLEADETVHHRNGIKHDNRLENLEIRLLHPPGQSLQDLLPWATDLLRRYAPHLLLESGQQPAEPLLLPG